MSLSAVPRTKLGPSGCCFSYRPIAVTESWTKATEGRNEGSQFKGPVWQSGWQDRGSRSHCVHTRKVKGDELWHSAQRLLFLQPGIPAHHTQLRTLQRFLSSKSPIHRDAQRFVSMVTLDPVTLTIKMNHYTQQQRSLPGNAPAASNRP